MLTILIVDDIEEERKGIEDFVDWDSLDIRVVGTAVNGFDGLQKALKYQPDIILTDIYMPIMDGIKMSLKLKDELPKADIIFMSCHDEFKYIKSAFDMGAHAYILKPIDLNELISTLKNIIAKRLIENEEIDLRRQIEIWRSEGLSALRDRLVSELLFGNLAEKSEIDKKLKFLDIPIDVMFSVVSITIENYESVCSNITPEDKYLVINHLKSELNERLNHTYAIVSNNKNLTAMIMMETLDKDDAMNILMDTLGNAKMLINNLGLETTIGIGGISSDFRETPTIFHQAEKALDYRFSKKGDSIIFAPEIKEVEIAEFDLEKLYSGLAKVIETGNVSVAVNFIEQFMENVSVYPENAVKSLCISLVSALNAILIDKNESLEKIFESENLVWNKLMNFTKILDIKQWLTNILRSVIEYLNDSEGERYQKIVDDIKAIVDEKYAELKNINDITQRIYLSASYANKIFKKYTNQTIFGYLVSKKMESAKELLSDPYIKIYEVAEKIGYDSKAYFSSTFREYTGYLPKDYRLKIKSENKEI